MTTLRPQVLSSGVLPPEPVDALSVGWLQRYVRALVFLDLIAVLVASVVAVRVRFGSQSGEEVGGVSYAAIAVLLPVAWVAVLTLSRCYERRFLGSGPQEFQRVFNACVRLTAAVALLAYATRLELARGFVAIALPLGALLLLAGRYSARRVLFARRRRGACTHRVVVLGTYQNVQDLVTRLRKEPMAGLEVVGACVPGGQREIQLQEGPPVPVLGGLTAVHRVLAEVQADTVAVTASPGLQGEALRRLSYDLEGSGVDLLVAPAMTNVSGTRISIRPVAGLPLMHLDEPELSGVRTLIKTRGRGAHPS